MITAVLTGASQSETARRSLQALIDAFSDDYNNRRPHRSLPGHQQHP
ncbi:integrase core domain-containing protein [Raineyella sp.]|nr:integrase core domain-containing protein [Raineyella sp.]MEA5155875.1 integrase core domain-containing protein [Raineyella sp.]